MDVRHLSVFVAVAREMSFTRAADSLLLAQSAVSTTVRELERELGVELFDRSHRQIRLTGAGEELLTRARAVLEQMREIGEAVSTAATELRGAVTMGLMTGVDLVDVPGLLGRYHERHPAVAVQLRATGLGSSGLVAQLERGEIDLALLAVVDALPASLRGEIVAASPYVLVVPGTHRLAEAEAVNKPTTAQIRKSITPDALVRMFPYWVTPEASRSESGCAWRSAISAAVPESSAV